MNTIYAMSDADYKAEQDRLQGCADQFLVDARAVRVTEGRSDLRDTLDHILRLCNSSRTYTRRTQEIHEVAMKGLGMTANQREARHVAILTRIGGAPLAQAYRERAAKRRAKLETQP